MQGYTLRPVDDCVLLDPNPARTKPKPGHWRITPGARIKMPAIKRHGSPLDNPLLSGRVEGNYLVAKPEKNRGLRDAVRLAVAAGLIDPADAPSWAQ